MAWIGAIVQGVMGGIQMGVAKAELDALPDPQGFSTSSELATATSMARRAAQQGMSPAERAAAEQAIGTAQSRTQRSMEQRGLGNLAAAVSQIRTTEAMNQLAAQNAQIKRQSLGQYSQLAGQMQQLQDRNTQSFNQMLYAQQQALGQAAQAGFSNLAGMGGSIAMAIEGADAAKEEAIGDDAVTKTSMTSMPTSDLLPTTDTSAAPDIPAGSGYPGITAPDSSSTESPFGLNVQAERDFQDYANEQAGSNITKGYGWGPASSAAYNAYGGEYPGLPTSMNTMSSYQLPNDTYNPFAIPAEAGYPGATSTGI